MTIQRVLAFILLGITLLGCEKKAAKVEDIAAEPISDPLKIDTGYISGTLIGDVVDLV